MSVRKSAVLASAVALVAGVTPLLTAADAGVSTTAAAPTLPKAGCFDIKDPDAAGDAYPLGEKQAGNDSDLDILGAAFQTTATNFRAFIKVSQLADGPKSSTDGHRYTVTFELHGHVFSLAGSSFSHGTGAIREALASQGKAGHTVQLGVDTPAISPATAQQAVLADRGYKTSGLAFTWDKANSWVIVDLPIKDIEKYAGAKFTGRILGVGVFSATDEYAVSSTSDTTESGNGSSYTASFVVGQNKCFPAPKPVKKRR